MSQNYNNFQNFQVIQNVNSDQTSLVAKLMSPTTTSIINKTTTSSSTKTTSSCNTTTPQTTTHSIKNSHNNNVTEPTNNCRDNINSRSSSSISNLINNTTTHHKKSLINPALVKRKHYSKSKKQTTSQQWDVILEHMNRNPNLARGIPVFGTNKKEIEDLWEELTKKLNAIGPPQRDSKDWKKVWSDLRTRTKKKIGENKQKARGTGGGLNTQTTLSSIEQACDSLLNISMAAKPPGEIFGIEINNSEISDLAIDLNTEILPPDIERGNNDLYTPPLFSTNESLKRKITPEQGPQKKGFESQSLDLLREQANHHNEMLVVMKELVANTKKIAEALEVLANWTK